ncbi:MAG: PLP-dependent aminotransferase family protein [Oscillospiraceae bacterium]|nr:PLP-dependent aminotransferase family protein [Oscillospiraceae bacterium]
MKYTFSNRVNGLKPSTIREILKYSSDPGMIPLAAGNPSQDAFPTREIAEIAAAVLSENPVSALQYSVTEGYAPLREKVSSRMKDKYNIGRDFDELLITSGAQQVMDLAAKSLCNSGDAVICEEPSFIGSLNTFRSFGVRLIGVPLESDGMDMRKLETILKTEAKIRFIYTIPNFQNPSGLTMSLEKRKKLYALAGQYSALILEDNPYGDLRAFGEDIPSVKSFDEDGLVIYAGSFSKVLAPGLRVGYAVAPAEICRKMTVCKQGEDVHTNILAQIICERFMSNYDFEGHLKKIQKLYRGKIELAVRLMDEYFGEKIKYGKPDGGLFVWCELAGEINMQDFCAECLKHGVCVVPGSAFLTDETKPCQFFRINFSAPADKQLEQGIKILGDIAGQFL